MASAAKPVLSIDVDDKAFTKFIGDYQKFESSLTKMPAQWAKLNQQIKQGQQQMAALQQQAVTQGKTLVHQHAQISAHSKQSHGWWEKMSHHAKHVREHVAHVTKHILSWTGVGSIFGSLLGAGGFMGIGRLAERATELRKASTASGFRANEHTAFQIAYGHSLSNPNEFIGGVSTAMSDETSRERATVDRMLGFGFHKGKTGGQIGRALIEQIRERTAGMDEGQYQQFIENWDLQGFGVRHGDLRTIKSNPKGGADYDRLENKLKIDDESLKKWSKLTTAWEEAAAWVERTLMVKLGALAGPLEQLTAAFSKLLVDFLNNGNFEKMIKWMKEFLVDLNKYLNNEQGTKMGAFIDEVKSWIESGKEIASNLARIAAWLAQFMPGSSAARPGEKPAVSEAEVRKHNNDVVERYRKQQVEEGNLPPSGPLEQLRYWWKGLMRGYDAQVNDINNGVTAGPGGGQGGQGRRSGRGFGGGGKNSGYASYGSDPASATGGFGGYGGRGAGASEGTGGVSASDYYGGKSSGPGGYAGTLADDVKAFMDMGWSHANAVGIVANLKDESGGRADIYGDRGAAYGLAQWHPDRRANFRRVFGYEMNDPSVPAKKRHEDQLKFVDWELRNTEAAAGVALRSQTTFGGSAAVFADKFERPADRAGAMRNRAATSNTIGYMPAVSELHIYKAPGVDASTAFRTGSAGGQRS